MTNSIKRKEKYYRNNENFNSNVIQIAKQLNK